MKDYIICYNSGQYERRVGMRVKAGKFLWRLKHAPVRLDRDYTGKKAEIITERELFKI